MRLETTLLSANLPWVILWWFMNDFDLWNVLKQKIDARKSRHGFYANVGDVWMALVGRNVGYEENGKGSDFSRPVLIVKKFNSNMVWALPMSTKQKPANFYYNFTDPFSNKTSLIMSQLRLISTKRLKRKLYKLPLSQFDLVILKLRKYL